MACGCPRSPGEIFLVFAWIPTSQEEVVEVAGQRSLWASPWRLLLWDPDLVSGLKTKTTTTNTARENRTEKAVGHFLDNSSHSSINLPAIQVRFECYERTICDFFIAKMCKRLAEC